MIPYLQVEGLSKSFGNLLLFEQISFGISQGERIGLVAKNGSGKTTLLNILTNQDYQDEGKIIFKKDLHISYLPQNPFFDPDTTILEACFKHGNQITEVISKYEELICRGETDGLDEILSQMDLLKAWDYEHRVKQILSQLKITNFQQKIKTLSGGQVKRVALANALIVEPDLIILDEPTNHLDLEMIEWLEKYLSGSSMSLLMVTHDRYFLDRVCTKILEIDNNTIYKYDGNYSYFVSKKEERIENEHGEQKRSANLYRKELEWMRRQPKARGTKSKSRKEAFYELEKKAKATFSQQDIKLETGNAYIGNKIFEMTHVSKKFGEKKILDDFSYTFARYEKLGIVGDNGTGKSTFIKILLGEIKPDSGMVDIGETVNFGYYSQDGLVFNENDRVIDAVKKIAEVIDLGKNGKFTASQFLQHFLFSPEKQYSFISKLSGGEKRRLYLCTILMKNPNFLVLDEPTNDLDIITLNILEEYLANFKGCLIVISHDRYFMDKVVDHLFVFSGNGNIKDFPGNYTQYRLLKEQTDKEQKQQTEPKTRNISYKEDKSSQNTEKKKLSFKEKKEFETLEYEISELEQKKSLLEEELSSGTISGDELLKKSNEIGFIIRQIDEKTDRWLELSQWT